jgi:phosphoglycerate dehydrogenase-like enzyme
MALFCTDTFFASHGDRIVEAAPGLEVVTLGSESVAAVDIERITIAFFSHDAWPERAAAFMRVGLDAPNLSWLHTMSAGTDAPIFGTFLERGVRVTTSSGASAPSIAGTVMMYLLALSRGLPAWSRAQQAHEWKPSTWHDLAGQRIAVVGAGPIGREVVRLATAFGMEPCLVRRRALGDESCPVRPLAELRSALADAEVVVLALPLNDDTRELFDAAAFAAMRPGALFVNVGRGEVVDQRAMTHVLRSGHLGGAGLDVFDPEPLPPDDPLWDLPNVIISPHNSGTSDLTNVRVNDIFIDNLARFHAGEPLRNEVEPVPRGV